MWRGACPGAACCMSGNLIRSNIGRGICFTQATFDDGDGDIALFGRRPEVVPGFLARHFTGGEPLRAVLPKEKKAR